MKLHIITIVLDGMKFLPEQFYTFNRLNLDWQWIVVEGAAANKFDTKWCKPQRGRVSEDGSHAFLKQLAASHPRVKHHWSPMWDSGKTEMVNRALCEIHDPGLLLQVDADEMWTAAQLEGIVDFFKAYDTIDCARFFCRYFVGPNLITVGENCYGNNPGEWLRAWRFTPGQRFVTHEPPNLSGQDACATREQTRECGLVFDHYAYAFESQVEYKEMFYGYTNAVKHWRRLQANTVWPARLGDFLPWVTDHAQVTKI